MLLLGEKLTIPLASQEHHPRQIWDRLGELSGYSLTPRAALGNLHRIKCPLVRRDHLTMCDQSMLGGQDEPRAPRRQTPLALRFFSSWFCWIFVAHTRYGPIWVGSLGGSIPNSCSYKISSRTGSTVTLWIITACRQHSLVVSEAINESRILSHYGHPLKATLMEAIRMYENVQSGRLPSFRPCCGVRTVHSCLFRTPGEWFRGRRFIRRRFWRRRRRELVKNPTVKCGSQKLSL